jgi:hypothetical protein
MKRSCRPGQAKRRTGTHTRVANDATSANCLKATNAPHNQWPQGLWVPAFAGTTLNLRMRHYQLNLIMLNRRQSPRHTRKQSIRAKPEAPRRLFHPDERHPVRSLAAESSQQHPHPATASSPRTHARGIAPAHGRDELQFSRARPISYMWSTASHGARSVGIFAARAARSSAT